MSILSSTALLHQNQQGKSIETDHISGNILEMNHPLEQRRTEWMLRRNTVSSTSILSSIPPCSMLYPSYHSYSEQNIRKKCRGIYYRLIHQISHISCICRTNLIHPWLSSTTPTEEHEDIPRSHCHIIPVIKDVTESDIVIGWWGRMSFVKDMSYVGWWGVGSLPGHTPHHDSLQSIKMELKWGKGRVASLPKLLWDHMVCTEASQKKRPDVIFVGIQPFFCLLDKISGNEISPPPSTSLPDTTIIIRLRHQTNLLLCIQ